MVKLCENEVINIKGGFVAYLSPSPKIPFSLPNLISLYFTLFFFIFFFAIGESSS